MRDFYFDKDKSTLFLDCFEGEDHYAFALFVDFFLAKRKSLHSSHVNLKIIAMAYLNLSPDIQYKSENMYLAGIVSEFEESKFEKLNHYICFLIIDIMKSWKDSVYLL